MLRGLLVITLTRYWRMPFRGISVSLFIHSHGHRPKLASICGSVNLHIAELYAITDIVSEQTSTAVGCSKMQQAIVVVRRPSPSPHKNIDALGRQPLLTICERTVISLPSSLPRQEHWNDTGTEKACKTLANEVIFSLNSSYCSLTAPLFIICGLNRFWS